MKNRSTSIAVAGLIVGIGLVAAGWAWQASRPRRRIAVRDYSGRSGLPRPADEMRGAARADFAMPSDMGTPAPLRPLGTP
jgi:hypothetical protein